MFSLCLSVHRGERGRDVPQPEPGPGYSLPCPTPPLLTRTRTGYPMPHPTYLTHSQDQDLPHPISLPPSQDQDRVLPHPTLPLTRTRTGCPTLPNPLLARTRQGTLHPAPWPGPGQVTPAPPPPARTGQDTSPNPHQAGNTTDRIWHGGSASCMFTQEHFLVCKFIVHKLTNSIPNHFEEETHVPDTILKCMYLFQAKLICFENICIKSTVNVIILDVMLCIFGFFM